MFLTEVEIEDDKHYRQSADEASKQSNIVYNEEMQAQFDEVDFDWLLLGTSKKVSFAADDLKKQETATEKKEDFKEENIQLENQSNSPKNRPSELLKIVEFYKDGTFDVFLPKS